MAHITTGLILEAHTQAHEALVEARVRCAAFTVIRIVDGNGLAFIEGARSFENARQFA